MTTQSGQLAQPDSSSHRLSERVGRYWADGTYRFKRMPFEASRLNACHGGHQALLKHALSFNRADPGLKPCVAAAWAAEVQIPRLLSRVQKLERPECGPPV